jgi:GT2 family glycosyltransferase
MDVGFLLLSTDEAALLEPSLAAARAEEPADLLVVDNASNDGTAEIAARHGARVLRLDRRVSYCEAMNAGLAEVRGEAVALLQADCFVAPGFRAAAVAALGDPAVGAVAPKLIRTAGGDAADRLEQLDAAGMTVDRRRKNSLVGHGRPASAFGDRAEAFGADGAGAVYRRRTLEDCAHDGGEVFDPALERWASDADVAWRARVLGWKAVYEPAAVAFHIRTYSPSTRAAMSEASRQMQYRNRYLMMAKNDSWAELARAAPWLLTWEALALGHVILRERHLLAAYREAWRRLPAARQRRRTIQAKRRVRRVPFGLMPPE